MLATSTWPAQLSPSSGDQPSRGGRSGAGEPWFSRQLRDSVEVRRYRRLPLAITGDVGASPITGAAIGLTCTEVTGTIYTVDAAGPLPCRVTDATRLRRLSAPWRLRTTTAGRPLPEAHVTWALGNRRTDPGSRPLQVDYRPFPSPRRHPQWGPNDVWIFQVAGTLNQAAAKKVTLTGGAQAKNVFWQSAGAVTHRNNRALRGNDTVQDDDRHEHRRIDQWPTAGADGSHPPEERCHAARSVVSLR